MNAYDCRQTDKRLQDRIDEIYGDPARHKFSSCYDEFVGTGVTQGPRGGKLKAKKSICFYCGRRKKYHALVTEEL